MDELGKQEFIHKDYGKNKEFEKHVNSIPEAGLLYLKEIDRYIKKFRSAGKESPEMQDMAQAAIDQLMLDAVLYYEKYKNNKEVNEYAEHEVF
jgi:hypothetical protein